MKCSRKVSLYTMSISLQVLLKVANALMRRMDHKGTAGSNTTAGVLFAGNVGVLHVMTIQKQLLLPRVILRERQNFLDRVRYV